MPKVIGPLLSQDARGRFGHRMIFKRGGIVVNYFKPRNPNSAAQQAQREAFKEFSVPGLTQEQADLLYAAILHLHDDVYSLVGHDHDANYSPLAHEHIAAVIPSCLLKKSTSQSVASATTAVVSWDVETFDTDGMHSNSSDTSRIIAKTAGVYLIALQIVWESNNVGVRQLLLRKNGTSYPITVIFPNNNAGEDQNYIFTVEPMSVDDYFEALVWHGAAGALNIQGNRNDVRFSAVKIG